MRAGVQLLSIRLTRTKLNSNSFHVVLALSNGPVKFQCSLTTETVVLCRETETRDSLS